MALRIVLTGQAAFGEKTLERLAPKHDVAAVYCPPDKPGRKPDPLKTKAIELGVPVFQPKSMKTDEVHEQFRELAPDLLVLAFVTVIVPERVIRTPRLGAICFHPSLLPRYRGGSAINWQIIRGETESGLTVFWTDAGIDTGPILLQKKATIGPDDTTGSFYFEKIFPLGVDAMEEAVDLVERGEAPSSPQDESRATYDPLCRDEHVEIDWNRPGREVYDLVRGADPQPGAWSMLRGEKVRLYDARYTPGEGAEAAGTILSVGENGVVLGLRDGELAVGRLRPDGDAKKAAHEVVRERGLTEGARFGEGASS